LEKLLRDCFDIEKVYIIIRTKRNQGLNARIKKLFESNLFDRLKVENENFMKKVHLIGGDLTVLDNFGISDDDLELLRRNVNFVIHCAGKN
jgi:fatty acyl-CoA reductase